MKKSTLCGIYCIRKDNKFYVGQSIDIFKRFNTHKRNLVNKKHSNRKLQSSCDKHGIDSFEFEIIEIVDSLLLAEREQYWIDTLDSFNCGYNLSPSSTSTLGMVMSEDARRKMSIIKKASGFRPSKQAFEASALASRERHAKLRELRLNMTPEEIELTKYKISDKARAALSKSLKKRRQTGVTKSKISAANSGRIHSDLSKEKMREAWKRRKGLSTENKPNLRCKLNYSLAEQIRTEYSSGLCPEDLSIKYSVSKSTIHRIISRKIWIKQ
jgi:group I intron endonuclease